MTEDERQAIRKSFAGKRVSQMTVLERKVFDEYFQYGVAVQIQHSTGAIKSSGKRQSTLLSILKCIGLFKNS